MSVVLAPYDDTGPIVSIPFNTLGYWVKVRGILPTFQMSICIRSLRCFRRFKLLHRMRSRLERVLGWVQTVLMVGPSLVFKAHVPAPVPPTLSRVVFDGLPVATSRTHRSMTIMELDSPVALAVVVSGVRRKREGDNNLSPKKSRISLAVGKTNMNAESMGLVLVTTTQEVPRGAKNKKPI